jgi:hypothetical protein
MNPTFQESTFLIELKVSFRKNQIKVTQDWRIGKHNLVTVPDIKSMNQSLYLLLSADQLVLKTIIVEIANFLKVA